MAPCAMPCRYVSNLEKTVALYAKKEKVYEAEIAALKARLAHIEQ